MMRERIARAGYQQALDNLKGISILPHDTWENQTDLLREDWLKVADTVLNVMREPTKGMMGAGCDHLIEHHYKPHLMRHQVKVRDIWRVMVEQAMIDEAKK